MGGLTKMRRTVPVIWRKGRPTLVCQLWGDCAKHKRRECEPRRVVGGVGRRGAWRGVSP